MTSINKLQTLLTLTRMNLGDMLQTVNTWRLRRIVWAVSTCFRSYFKYCQRLYLCICFTSTCVHLPWLIYCSIHFIWKPYNSKLNSVIPQYEYCDALPESRNIGGCISDCFLDNGVPNTGNRRIAAVPIQRERQQTLAMTGAGECYTTAVFMLPSATHLLKRDR
jgi:hypothetical protein